MSHLDATSFQFRDFSSSYFKLRIPTLYPSIFHLSEIQFKEVKIKIPTWGAVNWKAKRLSGIHLAFDILTVFFVSFSTRFFPKTNQICSLSTGFLRFSFRWIEFGEENWKKKSQRILRRHVSVFLMNFVLNRSENLRVEVKVKVLRVFGGKLRFYCVKVKKFL